MIEHRIEKMILPITLSALGCEKSLTISPSDGEPVKFSVRLRDSVRFLIIRWNSTPSISIGIPIVAGVPLDQIEEVALTRLRERYALLQKEWPRSPDERYPGEAAEYPQQGNN